MCKRTCMREDMRKELQEAEMVLRPKCESDAEGEGWKFE